MTISSISAASLGEFVSSASNSNSLNQILQTLQNSLASGDFNGAQSAFQVLQKLLQNSASADGATLSSNSQLSGGLSVLGNALSSGDLSTAQSAFAALQKDLKTTSTPSTSNEATAASEAVQLVSGLLGSLTSNSSDPTASLLQSYYSSKSGVNVFA